MRLRVRYNLLRFSRSLVLFGAGCMGIMLTPAVWAQNDVQLQGAPGEGQSKKSTQVPEWQRAAGGKMAFEVASIRPTPLGKFTPPNFGLGNDDSYGNVHGVFSANFPVSVYILFAYKIRPSPEEWKAILAKLPKWVDTELFTIQARAAGEPTKDQMRLMMQSLLADRFKLAVHFETRVVPVLALKLDKAGKTGPRLRPHAEGPPCNVVGSVPPRNGSSTSIPPVFPVACDVQAMFIMPDHQVLHGSRNTTMQLLAESLSPIGNLGLPVVDQTGLTGKFDYTLLFTPDSNVPPGSDGNTPPDTGGTTFLEALKEQLGLKLTRTKAPVSVLVVDHIELPSEN